MDVRVAGGQQLRAVARDLRAAGGRGRGLRSKMRRNMVAAVKPMQAAVKSNILEIPAAGVKHTGLRRAMARAVKIRITPAGRNPVVRLWVNPALMPANQRSLPPLMEGSDGARRANWRHPVWGHRDRWVPQGSHPYFARAVMPRLAGVRAAVIAAVSETAAEVERGV